MPKGSFEDIHQNIKTRIKYRHHIQFGAYHQKIKSTKISSGHNNRRNREERKEILRKNMGNNKEKHLFHEPLFIRCFYFGTLLACSTFTLFYTLSYGAETASQLNFSWILFVSTNRTDGLSNLNFNLLLRGIT